MKMVLKISQEQKDEILKLKKEAEYRYQQLAYRCGRNKKHNIVKLANAFMKYVDYLGLDRYKPKHFNLRRIDVGMGDKIFSPGELGKITIYLKRENLIYDDDWGRYVVNWRKGHRTL
jgi:hypothetical protein